MGVMKPNVDPGPGEPGEFGGQARVVLGAGLLLILGMPAYPLISVAGVLIARGANRG